MKVISFFGLVWFGLVWFGLTFAQSPLLPTSPFESPNAYNIIELDKELFMVHMIPDMPTGSNYRVYNFPATINISGLFRLASDVVNSITIAADDVTLDMNGHRISGGITVMSGQQNITIKDGTVDVANAVQDAISVIDASNIALDNLKVRNATQNGILFDGVIDSTICNCDFSSNTTGLELCSSHNIIINNCQAVANESSGFSLVRSNACCIKNCQAIATGQGNMQTSGQIVGFISSDGYENLFERCIANGTQGLQITDVDSIVAGFILKGVTECSKIINSESINTMVDQSGSAQAYGIDLENNPITLDVLAVNNNSTKNLGPLSEGLAISYDSKYIATFAANPGGASTDILVIFEYDPDVPSLTFKAQASATGLSDSCGPSVSWSPINDYIVLGVGITVGGAILYEYNRASTLTVHDSVNLGASNFVYSVDWHPDGEVIALAGTTAGVQLRLYEIIADALSEITGSPYTQHDANILTISWSRDGNYLAVGGVSATDGKQVRVYSYNKIAQTLTEITTAFVNNVGTIYGLSWSPNGQYLLTFGVVSASANTRIYSFDGTALTELVAADSRAVTGTNARVNWSPNGKLLEVGGIDSGGFVQSLMQVYRFDPPTTLTPLESFTVPGPNGTLGSRRMVLQTIAWAPNGNFIATGSDDATNGITLRVLDATYDAQKKNIIANNAVYGTSGGSQAIGISGDDVSNLIIQNVVYNNSINLQLGSNIDQIISCIDNPTAVTNIAICEPIQTPLDIELMAKQIEAKLCDVQTKIDALLP